MFQSDIKRVLAYSTISHCGFLMVLYSTGVIEYTILYLYVHGFFKAATFLSVGNIIRFSRNTQDFKRMGFFYKTQSKKILQAKKWQKPFFLQRHMLQYQLMLDELLK